MRSSSCPRPTNPRPSDRHRPRRGARRHPRAAPGGQGKARFRTEIDAMLKPGADAPAGVVIDPIISVGDELDSGFVFDSIPDGISLVEHGQGRVDLYVNHETSLVPFPGTLTDYTNSHVDLLALNQCSAGVLRVDAIPSEANFQRFCSNFLATAERPSDRSVHERGSDRHREPAGSRLARRSRGSQPEQAGVVVALDIEPASTRPSTAWAATTMRTASRSPATTTSSCCLATTRSARPPPSSTATSRRTPTPCGTTRADCGRSSARMATTTTAISPSATTSPASSSPSRATSRSATRTPSRTGRTRTTCSSSSGSRTSPTTATTRTSCTSPTPASRGPSPIAATGRLQRGPAGTMGPYPNGRIFRMVLDDADPTQVDSLTILIDADAGGSGNRRRCTSRTTSRRPRDSLLIQEDPGSHNQFAVSTTRPGSGSTTSGTGDLSTVALDAHPIVA